MSDDGTPDAFIWHWIIKCIWYVSFARSQCCSSIYSFLHFHINLCSSALIDFNVVNWMNEWKSNPRSRWPKNPRSRSYIICSNKRTRNEITINERVFNVIRAHKQLAQREPSYWVYAWIKTHSHLEHIHRHTRDTHTQKIHKFVLIIRLQLIWKVEHFLPFIQMIFQHKSVFSMISLISLQISTGF